MQIKTALLLVCGLISNTLLASQIKYPIYKLGIKFSKPSNYFLANSENANDLKNRLLTSSLICASAKKSVEIAFKNPNFKLFLNEKNYNEQIFFNRVSRFKIGKDITSSIKERIKEQCFLEKSSSVVLIRDTAGLCRYGMYSSLLFKIITPETTYYSEGFFIEGKTVTLIVTINTTDRVSSQELINSIEDIDSERYEGLIGEINELMSLKKYDQATLKADTCIILEPLNVRGIDKRMSLNLYYKKYDDVIRDANLIISIDENYLNGFIVKGLAYFNMNKLTAAIECFELAQKKFAVLELVHLQNDYYSSFSQLYRLTGEAYIGLKNSEKAIGNLEAALQLSIDSLNTGSIYYNIGVVKSSLEKNIEEAIKYYSLAIINYSNSNTKEMSEALFNRAINYRKKGSDQEALSDYTKAIKIRPDYVKAYNNRAIIKLNVEDYKGAITDCNEVIKYDKGKTEFTGMAYFNRGLAKINLNDISGCQDMKKAKSLGQSIPKEIMVGCQIK